MEFLLINHPLDADLRSRRRSDLQDQAMGYGRPPSIATREETRVEDKYMGRCQDHHDPLHLTRCIRFSTEVAAFRISAPPGPARIWKSSPDLEKAIASELSGHVIDLCPVGALTRSLRLTARPWGIEKDRSIDVMDAMGCNTASTRRGREVMAVPAAHQRRRQREWIATRRVLPAMG